MPVEVKVGDLAFSKAGHDKGSLYYIIKTEGDRVYLADGRLRPTDRPKIKNIKHIQPVKHVCEEIRNYLLEKTCPSDADIVYIIRTILRRKGE